MGLTKQDKQEIFEIITRVVRDAVAPIVIAQEDLKRELQKYATKEDLKRELQDELAKYASKEDLVKSRDAIYARIDRLEDSFKEDLAAMEGRLTVRLQRYADRMVDESERRMVQALNSMMA